MLEVPLDVSVWTGEIEFPLHCSPLLLIFLLVENIRSSVNLLKYV